MQVNRIQSNNYGPSFAQLGRPGSSRSNKAVSQVTSAVKNYCSNGSNSNAKELIENLIDKCNIKELRELKDIIHKKIRNS